MVTIEIILPGEDLERWGAHDAEGWDADDYCKAQDDRFRNKVRAAVKASYPDAKVKVSTNGPLREHGVYVTVEPGSDDYDAIDAAHDGERAINDDVQDIIRRIGDEVCESDPSDDTEAA